MNRLGWIALAVILVAVNTAVSARTAISDLRKDREWQLRHVSSTGGELDDVAVRVETIRAISTSQNTKRAVIHVRLSFRRVEGVGSSWIGCDPVLRDSKGRSWLPLEMPDTDGAIKAIAPDHRNNGRCNLAQFNATIENGTLSDQIYLVPMDVLADLSLLVSGHGTRPHALAIPIKPALTVLN